MKEFKIYIVENNIHIEFAVFIHRHKEIVIVDAIVYWRFAPADLKSYISLWIQVISPICACKLFW